MKKIFTPVRIIAFAGALALTGLVYTYASAQTDDKDKKKTKIEKKIEIVEENGSKKVTVTTIENGNKKVETFTGEEAEAYLLKEHGGNNNGNFHMSFDFDIDTLLGKNSFDFNMNGFGEEFEKGMQEMMEELKKEGAQMQFDFKEMFKDLDSAFSGNNFKTYSFNFDNDFKNLDSLLSNFDFDIHIEADDDNLNSDEPRKKRIIVAHSVVIEDMDKKKNAEKDLNITDLSFYPNPSGGNFNLRYKSESMDMIDISVADLNGKTVYNERISATGTVIRNIELNEPSGTYILNLKQGKKQVSKKLIIK